MNLSKSSWKQNLQRRLLGKVLVLLIRLTGITARILRINPEVFEKTLQKQDSVIVATWHQNIYFSTWLLRKQDLTALISNSPDGEAIYQVMSRYGFQAVRGSSTRGGIPALKQLINLLKEKHSVAITPDGPLGPPEKIQSGVVLLAKYSGAPIIPWHYEACHQWRLRSWDKHKIPKPFTTVVESYGEPFFVPQDLPSQDVPGYCEKLEAVLKKLMRETKEYSQ